MQTKIAAAAIPIINDVNQAIGALEPHIETAHKSGCQLIIFPEAIISGIDLSGNFSHDKTLALELDSPTIDMIRKLAAKHAIWIGFGFLELCNDVLYDSYLLLSDLGLTALHYRRMSTSWLARNQVSAHYACGNQLPVVDTPFGRMGVLLCGDLFDASILSHLASQNPDIVLHPMARAFSLSEDMQLLWDESEFPEYLAEYEKLSASILVCNALGSVPDDNHVYCGGAWFIQDDQVSGSLLLLQEGLLEAEI